VHLSVCLFLWCGQIFILFVDVRSFKKVDFKAAGSQAAFMVTFAARPVYPGQLPTCCAAKVARIGPQADGELS
jgi:hypothetical protein